MKYTEEDHPDHEYLSKALEKISAIATKNEESQEKYANVSKIVQIQSEFGKKEGNSMKLLQPDRLFIRQDLLDFQDDITNNNNNNNNNTSSHHHPPSKRRMVHLFNDLLLISKSKDVSEKSSKAPQYKLSKSISLSLLDQILTSTSFDNKPAITLKMGNHLMNLVFNDQPTRDSYSSDILSYREKLSLMICQTSLFSLPLLFLLLLLLLLFYFTSPLILIHFI